MTPGSPRWWRELGLESVMPQSAEPDREAGLARRGPAPSTPRATNAAAQSAADTLLRARTSDAAGSPRGVTPAPAGAVPGAQPADPERAARIAALDPAALVDAIEACSACGLRAGRRRSVPGVGAADARWMLVGEAPGAEEDQRGEPFVGAAGQLLDNMLAALGLARGQDVFIANVIKCRPPANRTPEAGECAQCLPFLERQIALVQPQIIVALGRVAAQALLSTPMNVGSLRGKVHERQGIPVVVTYHPAYLLRNLPEKSRAWLDLCLAQRTLNARSG